MMGDTISNTDRIKQEIAALEFNSFEGKPVVRLGVVITLYFRNGYTPALIDNIADCFRKFSSEFGAHLRCIKYKRHGKYSDHALRGALSEITSEVSRFELQVNNAASPYEVATYKLAALNTRESHGDLMRSYLKMVVPWSILETPDGVERFQAWVLYLSEQVDAEHGYAGLSTVLPYDFDRYIPIEYELSQKYPGLEVDTMAMAYSLNLNGAIKGVNWFTIINRTVLERLGGLESVRHQLSHHAGIQCFEYSSGLIVRAGALPELGSPTELPKHYVAANRVLKPLREPAPYQLHSYSEDGNGYDEERSNRWYSRFDEVDEPAPTPKKIAAGGSCTRSGYWFSPAQSNSRRFFKAGEVMPEFKGSEWGATFWYWSSEK